MRKWGSLPKPAGAARSGGRGTRPPRVAPSRTVKPLTVLEFIRDEEGVWSLPARLVADLARRHPDVRFESPPDRAAAERLLPEADVVYGVLVSAENFHLARRLRWIHVSAAGVGSLLFPALVESEVVLTNGRGLHAVSMAEHALGLMLAFARKLHLARDLQRERRWEQVGLWTGAAALRPARGRHARPRGPGGRGLGAGRARGGAGDARHRRAPAPAGGPGSRPRAVGPGAPARAARARGLGGAGRTAHRGDPRADRRGGAGAHEARRRARQPGPRRAGGRAGAGRRPARGADRRRGPRRRARRSRSPRTARSGTCPT